MTIVSETVPATRPRAPLWLIATALGGIAWNVFGVVQLAGALTATEASLIAGGLTPEQAAVMADQPGWMLASFAVGVFGGLMGSVLLLLRKPAAAPVLTVSLIAYVALWIGDALHGVFAVMGAPQVAILTLVVAIAAGLLVASNRSVAKA